MSHEQSHTPKHNERGANDAWRPFFLYDHEGIGAIAEPVSLFALSRRCKMAERLLERIKDQPQARIETLAKDILRAAPETAIDNPREATSFELACTILGQQITEAHHAEGIDLADGNHAALREDYQQAFGLAAGMYNLTLLGEIPV